MYPNCFKAVLKTPDDRILEYGSACISMENRSVDFKSTFVPLMKMGTSVKIVQLAGKSEAHAFVGEVYLSAPQLLRVVDVSEAELSEAQKRLEVAVSIPARLIPARSGFEALHPPQSDTDWMDAEIYSISTDTVKFSCARALQTGCVVSARTEGPLRLRQMILRVDKALLFGDGVTGHICSVDALPPSERDALALYVERQNNARRLFQDGAAPARTDGQSWSE